MNAMIMPTTEAALTFLGAAFDQIRAAVARHDGRSLRAAIDQIADMGFPRTAIVIRDTLHAQNIGGWADTVFGDVDLLPDHSDGDEITVTAVPAFQLTVTDAHGAVRTFGAALTAAGMLRIEIPPDVDGDVVGLLDACTEAFLTGRVHRTGPRPTLVLSMIEASQRPT